MAPRVHPCVCGYICSTYPQMKKHRRKCTPWKVRSNPMSITIDRLRRTRQEQAASIRTFEPCGVCGKRPDHHMSWCPNSQAEAVRRQALERHNLNPTAFDLFLRVLAKRYEAKPPEAEDIPTEDIPAVPLETAPKAQVLRFYLCAAHLLRGSGDGPAIRRR